MNNNIEINTKSIGQRIRQEREKLDLSREKFAEILGISSYYIGQLERGERQMSLSVLVKISNFLHLSLDYIVFGNAPHDANLVNEACNVYSYHNNKQKNELYDLINKCSPKELELFKKLIKTIIPYINTRMF